MNKSLKISLYSLMSAGYLSSAAYLALRPKTYLSEIKQEDFSLYKDNISKEIKAIFADKILAKNIYFLGKIEEESHNYSSRAYELLEEMLKTASKEVIKLIEYISKSRFIQKYVYCTDSFFENSPGINQQNCYIIRGFIYDYKLRYESLEKKPLIFYSNRINNTNDEENKIIVAKKKERVGKFSRKAGISLWGQECEIDKDASSEEINNSKMYVNHLHSLNLEAFEEYNHFLEKVLKDCSVRTKNGIRAIGYKNFYVNYLFASNEKLLSVRNLGKKSVSEISNIKPQIIEFVISNYEIANPGQNDLIKKKDKGETLKEKLSDEEYALVLSYFESIARNLSVRAQNALKIYQGDFLEDFVNKENNIESLKNIGKKSGSEINLLINNLSEFIDTLIAKDLSEEELEIIKKQTSYEEFFDEFARAFYLEYGHLPMFYLLERFFRSLLETNRRFSIYNLRTPIFINEDSYSLEKISDEFYLSRERVRQIHINVRKKLLKVEDIYTRGCSFATIINNNDWDYVIEGMQANNYIDISMIKEYCSQENHHFTDNFVLYIISVVGRNQLISIGNPILPYPTRSSDEWNNCYLIKKNLAEKFDFMKLIKLIKEYEDSNTEDLNVSAREMIIDTFLPAWIVYDSNVVEEVSDVVSNLLIQELGIIPDDKFCFKIEGKKEEYIADVIYDILKSNRNPLSCDELFQSIDIRYPNKYKSPASIKYIVERDTRLCLVGSNNLVALIEWEHVKLGSIRNIIVQFLERYDEPQQIKVIVSYVQKYRSTSENSIRSTMGSGNQFVQFSGGYYGLSWKEYPEVYSLDERDRVFYKRIQELEHFLQANKHFPFPSSNQEEQELYEWWSYVKSYLILSNNQTNEVKRIESQYNNLASKKKDLRWFDNCRQYYEFVKENHRRPSKSIPNEQVLCIWLEKASEDFTKGTLTQQQETCYLDLCKSL